MSDRTDLAEAAIETEDEQRTVERATAMPSRLVFETIRQSGDEELRRPAMALAFSGVAAGLLIAFSVLGEALLRANLPDAPWRYILENFGYSLGFLLVILGRMQLFTENTITTVVPVLITPTAEMFGKVASLWGIVLLANVVGAFAAGAFLLGAPVLSPEVAEAVMELSRHATGMGAVEGFARGIPAGVLIAALVWMLPVARGNELALIVLFTWLIALGDFTHIIAGSVEMAYVLLAGELGLGQALLGFFVPVLAGNVVGGTVVFTMLAWAQTRAEISED
ncbi:putative transport protein (plasmid) [Dinoroseobacter shibae DFL 12 = DSM 16493]|jgi:formate/nitrite transporter FocA (FNT family)|uniref:Putative transport protein n=1 Tax=Dinoroseobacter shibae (strain DSM 16493 / NCIMB 14021 / DFL 12) TaxID=398580 RepID=A8LTT3_DINSH|nr:MULTISPECIES: formate/nitrite transporter family protein [Dinoroseobacter]ABV95650.1 putative transport protein [Dinoroseobacter shibae DFL 12 = DSM 16493]MDD9718815.1 formate/nitrite transporter family protein [Dinoroseobacter sp. PD6]URF48855.1 formate/nitrite transporter family protein [Dinoroseobacter shibae]URF53167.1 formate/nitrite transporter family protein [Dinoroseobacter shibae]